MRGRGSPPIGRATELGRLRAALDELDRGAGGAVIVSGEPGIGKTLLLAELADEADCRGHLVLTGRGGELEGELPFSVIIDALDDYLASLDPGALGLAPEDLQLGGVLPSFDAGGASQVASPEARLRSQRAVRGLLVALARTHPLVLVLDDVHWADLASVHLIGYLLRHPPPAPVLLAMAVRPAQVSAVLAAAFDTAEREGAAERLEPAPLSRDEARQLLADLDPATCNALYREAGGNPFYLEQLRHTRGRPVAGSDLDLGEVPAAVVGAIAEELRALDAPIRQSLESAAVVGDTFEVGLLARVAGLGESGLLTILDELVRRDLVRPGDVPRWFRFRHPLVRRAVYESTGEGWRVSAHARAAAALAVAGAPLPVRARHVEASAHAGDDDAIALLTRTGETVAGDAPASAARWFAAALRLLPASADEGVRLGLLGSLADALAAAGQLEACRDALGEALTLVTDVPGLRRKLVGLAGFVEHLLGRHDEARALTERELAAVDPAAPEAAGLWVSLAYDGWYRAEYPAMRTAAESAIRAAGTTRSRGLRAVALALLALGDTGVGDLAAARTHATEAAALVDAMGDAELTRHLEAATMLAVAEYDLERFGAGLAHADRGLAVAAASGQQSLVGSLLVAKAITLAFLGRLDEAAHEAEVAYETSLLLADDQARPMAAAIGSKVAVAAGDLATAVRLGERAMEKSVVREGGLVWSYAAIYLAEALLESGDPAGARERLLAAVGTGMESIERPSRSRAYEILVAACLALGEIEAADGWLVRAETDLEGIDLGLRVAELGRARAGVALARGDCDRAIDAGMAAVHGAELAGTPVEAARCRIVLGRALASAARVDEAVTELTHAEDALTTLKANRYRDEAAQLLRRLGRPVRRGRPRGLGGLSAREREIAELVAAGRTNREIASRLFLSQKTVETHLAHVFTKLDVSARAAVARALDRS